jgi:hypothetical protein
MKTLRPALLLTAVLATASISDAQQPANPALKPLAFLSGRWISEQGTELQEENWSPITGDSMIMKAGKPVFYEFWVVEVEDNHPVLKMKHFNANLKGWEEKNTSIRMPVEPDATSENNVTFGAADGSVSLHYFLAGGKLNCMVHHLRNGKLTVEPFTLTRVPEH